MLINELVVILHTYYKKCILILPLEVEVRNVLEKTEKNEKSKVMAFDCDQITTNYAKKKLRINI